MSPTDCWRLLVLCLWLLHVDVNCANTQKGYVLRDQEGQVPRGVHNDVGNYKRWREPRIYRIPTAGYKALNVDRGQSAREDHTTSHSSSHIRSHAPTQNFPKGEVNRLKSDFILASLTQRRSSEVNDRSGNKRIHSGTVQVPIYRGRTKTTGGFSPVQVGFGQNNRKALTSSLKSASLKIESRPVTRPEVSRYPSGYVFPRSFNHDRASTKLSDQKTDVIVSSPAGNIDKLVSYPTWSPRVYSGDVTPGARGYAHVRHVKPAFDKTQVSSAASGKFLETGHGAPASSERQTSAGHPSPNRAQIPIQGKFKPFQRFTTLSLSSDGEPAQTPAGAALPASLNSTEITSAVVPPVREELSNESAPPEQTEGQDVELVLQASNPEDQSEGGASSERNKTVTAAPPKLQLAEEVGKDDKVVTFSRNGSV